MEFDLIIRGANVIDGSGAPRRRADVAVRGDRIAAIAPNLPAKAHTVIDGHERVLAPGFIDAHTHDDVAIVNADLMVPKLLQGVTTVVTGNCGISAAPWTRCERPPPPLDLIDRSTVPSGTFADYRAALQARTPQLNILMLLGLTTVRVEVMGDPMRAATKAEVECMQRHVAEALNAGAAGVSIGPYYPPARCASADEMIMACAPLQRGRHLLAVHLRDEGDHVMAALDEAMHIADHLGTLLVLSHHKLIGTRNHGRSAQTLAHIEGFARLAPVCFDCYPYSASSTMLDVDKVDTVQRVQVAWSSAQPEAAGRDLDELAREWQCTRRQATARLLPGGAIYFSMHDDDVRAILTHPLAMIGSDGLPHDHAPHPRLWGTFPRVLGPLVREQGWMTLESAVHKMSGLPAHRFGIKGRGRIEVGAFADLVVFDPGRINDRASYASPRNAPEGIECVIINGCVRVLHGQVTSGHANGRMLRASAFTQQ